jgi:integrase
MAGNAREIALFNLAIDSKLRGCDLVRLMVRDLAHGSQVLARATVVQQKTKQPVRFDVTDQTREALTAWIVKAKLAAGDYLFPSRQRGWPHLSTRQYARIVKGWIALLSADPQAAYGTPSRFYDAPNGSLALCPRPALRQRPERVFACPAGRDCRFHPAP